MIAGTESNTIKLLRFWSKSISLGVASRRSENPPPRPASLSHVVTCRFH
jgi:hypothetical protein